MRKTEKTDEPLPLLPPVTSILHRALFLQLVFRVLRTVPNWNFAIPPVREILESKP